MALAHEILCHIDNFYFYGARARHKDIKSQRSNSKWRRLWPKVPGENFIRKFLIKIKTQLSRTCSVGNLEIRRSELCRHSVRRSVTLPFSLEASVGDVREPFSHFARLATRSARPGERFALNHCTTIDTYTYIEDYRQLRDAALKRKIQALDFLRVGSRYPPAVLTAHGV